MDNELYRSFFTIVSVFSIFFCCLLQVDGVEKPEKKFAMKRLQQCDGKENLPILLQDFAISQQKRNIFITNITLNTKEYLKEDFSFSISVSQCPDERNADSCEYILKDVEIDDICEKLGEPDQVWSDFAREMKLQQCPIKPGKYSVVNFPIEVDFSFLPIQNGLYRLVFECHQDGKMAGCVFFEVVISTEVKGRT